MKIGRWFVAPLSGYCGGQVRWRPETWGVDVEVTSYDCSEALGDALPVDKTVSARLPWKVLAQMLLSRDDR